MSGGGQRLHDSCLAHSVLKLLVLYEVLLLHGFHRHHHSRIPMSNLEDPPERTFSDHFQDFKVFKHRSIGLPLFEQSNISIMQGCVHFASLRLKLFYYILIVIHLESSDLPFFVMRRGMLEEWVQL